jgi:lipoprotein NlpI
MLSFEAKDYAKALEWIEKSIKLNPKEAFFYNNRGLYLIYLGEHEKGLEDINYSLKQNPKNLYAIRNKGIYYFYKDQKELALSYFEEVYEKDPEIELVKEYIAKCNQK